MNINKWIKQNCTNLDGKTICITGSTGGLAQAFTEKLANLGANFIFANRNKEKSEKQKQLLLAKYPNVQIQILNVDLFDMNSVKLFVCKLKQLKVDILIINAGVYNVPRKTSNEGFDNVFQINFVSAYYIIKQMLPNLRKIKDSKVVAIGSIAHNYTKCNFNDIQLVSEKRSSKVYGNSKRFLMFSLYKLFENSPIKLAIVHPGVTLTQMTNHYPKAINWFVKLGIKLIFPKPEKACLSVLSGVYLALTQMNGLVLANSMFGDIQKNKNLTLVPTQRHYKFLQQPKKFTVKFQIKNHQFRLSRRMDNTKNDDH